MRGAGFLHGDKRTTADLSEGERQTHFFLLAQKETGLDPKEKGPATGLPGWWSLPAQALSRIGPCPDRRYGGNLVHADSLFSFFHSASGRRNPDRTGASKLYLLPLVVQGRGL